jgi:hypothetical protein
MLRWQTHDVGSTAREKSSDSEYDARAAITRRPDASHDPADATALDCKVRRFLLKDRQVGWFSSSARIARRRAAPVRLRAGRANAAGPLLFNVLGKWVRGARSRLRGP